MKTLEKTNMYVDLVVTSSLDRHLHLFTLKDLVLGEVRKSILFILSCHCIGRVYMYKLLCFRHLSESHFLLGALHRRSKFKNFCQD